MRCRTRTTCASSAPDVRDESVERDVQPVASAMEAFALPQQLGPLVGWERVDVRRDDTDRDRVQQARASRRRRAAQARGAVPDVQLEPLHGWGASTTTSMSASPGPRANRVAGRPVTCAGDAAGTTAMLRWPM
jgi:hypothetical protein